MPNEGSTSPKERVNIVYTSLTLHKDIEELN